MNEDFNLFDFQSPSTSLKSSLNPFWAAIEKKPVAQSAGISGLPRWGGMMSPTVGAPSVLPVNTETYPTRRKNVPSVRSAIDYLSDSEIEELVSQGASDEEIMEIAKEVAKEKAWQTEDKSFGDILQENFGWLWAGFTSVLWNVASASAYLDPTNYIGGRNVEEEAKKARGYAETLFWEKGAEEMGWYWAGKFIWEMTALSAIPVWTTSEALGPIVSKIWPEKLRAIGEYVKQAAPKSAMAAKTFIDSIPSAAQFQLIDEGRVTPETTAFYASLAPFLNVLKSVPWISKITGKSEILNASAINKWEAIYEEGGKRLLWTTAQLNAALDRVGWDASELSRKMTKEAIASIETKWISRPQDLVRELDKKITELSSARRKMLEGEKTLFDKTNSQAVYDYKWTKTVSSPIDDAFDDLEKAISPESRAQLQYLKEKYSKWGGLTANEVDDLSRLHKEYNNAFEKSWVISKSKEGFEGTRKELKGLVASTEIGKAAQILDKTMSPMIDLKNRAELIREAVDMSKSKIWIKFGEQAGRAISNAFDAKTGRWVAKTIGSTWELKKSTLSITEIAKKLKSDLELIKKLSQWVEKTRSEKEALEFIAKFKLDGKTPTVEYGSVIKNPSSWKSPVSIKEEFKKAVERWEYIPKQKNATGTPVEIRNWVYREPKKWEVIKKPSSTGEVNRKIVWLTEKGWVKNILPSNQIKLNQWTYKPVRVILSDKDKEIMEYVSFNHRTLSKDNPSKSELSKLDSMWKSLENKWVKESEAFKRASFIKEEAKKIRSKDSETILDLLRTEDKPQLKNNIPKPKK